MVYFYLNYLPSYYHVWLCSLFYLYFCSSPVFPYYYCLLGFLCLYMPYRGSLQRSMRDPIACITTTTHFLPLPSPGPVPAIAHHLCHSPCLVGLCDPHPYPHACLLLPPFPGIVCLPGLCSVPLIPTPTFLPHWVLTYRTCRLGTLSFAPLLPCVCRFLYLYIVCLWLGLPWTACLPCGSSLVCPLHGLALTACLLPLWQPHLLCVSSFCVGYLPWPCLGPFPFLTPCPHPTYLPLPFCPILPWHFNFTCHTASCRDVCALIHTMGGERFTLPAYHCLLLCRHCFDLPACMHAHSIRCIDQLCDFPGPTALLPACLPTCLYISSYLYILLMPFSHPPVFGVLLVTLCPLLLLYLTTDQFFNSPILPYYYPTSHLLTFTSPPPTWFCLMLPIPIMSFLPDSVPGGGVNGTV